MNKKYDVIIVGGGFVGLSLAIALAKLPLKIALVEAQSFTAKTQINDARPLALHYSSQQILHTLQVWPALQTLATPIQQVQVSQRGHFGSLRICASQEQVPALGYVVPAQQLLQILNQQCSQLASVRCYNPAKVLTLNHAEDAMSVTVQLPDKKVTLNGDLIIAADGTTSLLRHLAGIDVTQQDYDHVAIVANVELAHSHHNVAYERFTDYGAIAVLPFVAHQCGVVLTVTTVMAQELQVADDATFLQFLQREFGYRLGKFVSVGKRQMHPLRQQLAEQLSKQQLILIGNAAHTLHPIAAQGFNLGLRDIAVLLEILAEDWQQQSHVRGVEIATRYAAWCLPVQQQYARVTDLLARCFRYDFMMLNQLRAAGLVLCDVLPGIKHVAARWGMGRVGDVPKMACGIPVW